MAPKCYTSSKTDAAAEKLAQAMSLAVRCHQAGDLQNAEALYRQILRIDSKHADAWHLLGVVARQCGHQREAVELIDQAIRHNSRVAQYYFNRGVCLQELDDLGGAITSYRTAVRLKPDYPEAYDNLGVALQDSEEFATAIEAHKKALSFNPGSLLAHNNLGTLLQKKGDTAEALAHFQKALAIHPAEPNTRMKLAISQLTRGDLTSGWREYEWRHYSPDFRKNNPLRVMPFPKWDGSELTGRTILAYSEQGVGDEVMFASCVAELAAQAEHCLLECDPRLTALFSRSFPNVSVIARQPDRFTCLNGSPAVDWRIPTSSLPRFFRPSLESFPVRTSYLSAEPALQEKWRRRLAGLSGKLKVGISWRGGIDPRAQSARSIPLAFWQRLLAIEDISFVNLQYGDHHAEIETFHRSGTSRLCSFVELDPLRDLDEFSALISILDLVISIDNSTVHFAGALGTPVWVLLPALADWRWLERRTDSPWYSSAQLYRQRKPGQSAWPPLLAVVTENLRRFREEEHARFPSPIPVVTAESLTNSPAPPENADNIRPRPKVLLLNDTSFWYHWGCSCTSLAIHHQLRNLGFSTASCPIHTINNLKALPADMAGFDDIDCFERFRAVNETIISSMAEADVIVINGEGTLHDLHRGALGLLYLAYIAKKRLNKNVQIINHSCYPDNWTIQRASPASALYHKVYRELDFVAVREEASSRVVSEMGIDHTLSFDCLPLFVHGQYARRTQEKENCVVIAGSVAWQETWLTGLVAFSEHMRQRNLKIKLLIGANACPAADDLNFVRALHGLLKDDYELVNATSESEWLDTLASARLLVSGRFHHTIAAAFAGTPFIALGSNTPKLQGLLGMLGLDRLALPPDSMFIDRLLQMAEELLRNPEQGLLDPEAETKLVELSRHNFSGLELFLEKNTKDHPQPGR